MPSVLSRVLIWSAIVGALHWGPALARGGSVISGPVSGTRITESYARMVARDAYFWAWPMVNVYNRRLAFKDLKEPGLMGGIVPVAPLNRLSMLTDYIEPQQRLVACPNQDVVYGAGSIALDVSPVVLQVPDFGKRFWVYQVVDLRTDSFAELGAMYGDETGLLPARWAQTGKARCPRELQGVSRLDQDRLRHSACVPGRQPEDKRAVQAVISGIDMYPLAQFDGRMKRRDWAQAAKIPGQATGDAETRWVAAGQILRPIADRAEGRAAVAR